MMSGAAAAPVDPDNARIPLGEESFSEAELERGFCRSSSATTLPMLRFTFASIWWSGRASGSRGTIRRDGWAPRLAGG